MYMHELGKPDYTLSKHFFQIRTFDEKFSQSGIPWLNSILKPSQKISLLLSTNTSTTY